MIPMFDNLRATIRERKTRKLLNDAIREDRNIAQEVLADPIFHESFTKAGNSSAAQVAAIASAIAEKRLSIRKTKTETLRNYLLEKKSFRSSKSNTSTMVRCQIQYDRIDAYYNLESYFSRAVERQIETMMRNGFSFVTDDPEMHQVVHRDLAYMQWSGGKALNQTIYRMAKDLLKYGMVMVEKQKKRKWMPFEEGDGGSGGKKTPKLSNLRIITMLNMSAYVDPDSRIVGVTEAQSSNTPWKTNANASSGSGPAILRRDMAIGYLYDPCDELWPAPPCAQMLNDIMTLRSLEETVELIGYQFGSPMLHNKIGTEAMPAEPGEVQEVHNRIVEMAPNGMVSTDDRVTITAVKIQENIPDLIPAIEHFKTRVLIGSGSSTLSVGEGDTANRATGESLDDALVDRCKYVSNIIEDMFTYDIIPDILMSNGYLEEDIFTEDGDMKVKMVFHEMKLTNEIARVNNIINQWEGNMISFPEMRKALNAAPEVDESLLYLRMIQIPLAMAKPAVPGGEGGDGASGSGVSGKVKQATQPANQHGTKASPGSRKN